MPKPSEPPQPGGRTDPESWFRVMADCAPVMIWMSEPDKLCSFFNKQWLDFRGRSMQQELGNGWAEGVHPSDLERCWTIYSESFDERQPFAMDYRLLRADGEYRWIWDQGTPRYHADSSFAGYIGSCVDVTERRNEEEKLRQNEALLVNISAHTPLGLLVVDNHTDRILHCNHRFCEIWHVERLEESIRRDELRHGDIVRQCAGLLADPAGFTEQCARLRDENNQEILDDEIAFLDGRLIRRYSTQVVDAGGRCLGRLHTFEDITGRKQSEGALRNSEEQLRLVLEGSNDGFWDRNLVTGHVARSRRVAEILGFQPEEIEPDFEAMARRVHPDDLPAMRETLQAHLEGRTQQYRAEFRMAHKSGDWVWVLGRGKVVRRGPNGEPLRMTGTLTDITKHKHAEEEALQQQRDLRTLLDALPGYAFLKRADGVYKAANSRFAGAMGYSAGAVVGKSDFELLPHDLAHKYARSDRTVMELGEQHLATSEESTPQGERVVISTRKVPLRDKNGNPVGLVGLGIDITEQVLAQEALRASEQSLIAAKEAAESAARSKSELLAVMSHEIRTPMNGVIGMAELLLNTPLSQEQRGYANTIRVSADALLAIINDILDFSKAEAGKLDIASAPFHLRGTLEDVLELLAPEARRKGLELLYWQSARVPKAFLGDSGRIRQVVMNLAGNAVRFTERGHVLVEVDCGEITETAAELILSIHDTGIGIPPDKLDQLFLRFTQLDSSGALKAGGSGLGLAISKRVAELMGGRIEVTSAVGAGSTFRFMLHLPLAPELPETSPAGLRGVRVLIADAGELSRSITADLCSRWGMRPDEAASSPEAAGMLAKAQAAGDPYRVIVDGLALPDTGDVPVLVLRKPVKESILRETLSYLLRVEDTAAVQAPFPGALEAGVFAGCRVLVAEDNKINQKVAAELLSKLGCQVEIAANGLEAVEKARQREYDLILMDCQMPAMDGYQAAAGIRREQGSRKHTPIIAFTAGADESEREKCLAAGMDGYLSKPLQPGALQEIIRLHFLP